jgi:hypothetical protein
MVALIAEFSERFGLRQARAFSYLYQYKGLDYILQYYDVLHTLSFREAVDDLQIICEQNGGRLEEEKE